MGWPVSSYYGAQLRDESSIPFRMELVILNAQEHIIAVGGPWLCDDTWASVVKQASQLIEDTHQQCGLTPASLKNLHCVQDQRFYSHTFGVGHGNSRQVSVLVSELPSVLTEQSNPEPCSLSRPEPPCRRHSPALQKQTATQDRGPRQQCVFSLRL